MATLAYPGVTLSSPVDQKILHVKVVDGKVTVTDWPAENHDVGRILLADQEPSCQIEARET